MTNSGILVQLDTDDDDDDDDDIHLLCLQ